MTSSLREELDISSQQLLEQVGAHCHIAFASRLNILLRAKNCFTAMMRFIVKYFS